MIRVLLVDDSPIVLHILQRLLLPASGIEVVGTAANGREALELLPALHPDVICVDLHMPVMDGLEFTREVMASQPCPILVVSVSVEPGSHNVFQLLEAGAVDVFPKPHDIVNSDLVKLGGELASKIRILAGVQVFRRNNNKRNIPAGQSAPPFPVRGRLHLPIRMVVIGASTGGPQALHEILSSLPVGFPLPVVCVQHIGGSFLDGLVSWLAEAAVLSICKAMQGELPLPGRVYFAPKDRHLEFDDGGCFALTLDPPYDGHRPSITVTLRAAVNCFGAGVLGVLLTGMGRDGAEGMARIAFAGGVTLAQDEASSVVFGMSKEAVARGAVQNILPLEQIAPALIALANGQTIYPMLLREP
jgi:two-component system, chemotaxis family, protein-glutamate methylesterase/glutaminase